ncbi:ABC transporter ATP-binding protein [Wenzhouxiangella marina]|uniref:ABC transporter ATP-binding protein n=1 Tax=Wenzhouxiangella marina TaxID=1579979 RepID=A0A0K0XTK6_9GAMM|nr:ABC transporter ATP-binding protein [Wenzhouxiangella marina]AKS40956.1 ABC transporter ATP-binding protein [Wenzhouxiangella marina]MBB6087830.1 putative ABC transport system ATP-binding protein [Wenzhouxiangella marina]
MPSDALLRFEQVSRRFRSGREEVQVLSALDLSLAPGERLAIMGASGSGKSTLLHLAAGMDQPDEGRIWLGPDCLSELPEPGRTRLRARQIGLVFQDFNLIDSLSVYDNIALVPWLNQQPTDATAIRELCERLGIDQLQQRLPEELSGGERQRVAIARALIHRPALVLADEPTGNLDPDNAERVLELFDDSVRNVGCSLIMVTHDASIAHRFDRVCRLERGRLEAAQ